MVAVVPTYSPPKRTVDLIKVLTLDTKAVLVSDDASPCTSDGILREVSSIPGAAVLRHRDNAGIARGLNAGLHFAAENGVPWLLTVDQDSTVSDHYVAELVRAATERSQSGERLGALGAEVVADASGPMDYPLGYVNGFPVTEELIQSGTLWNVAALAQSAGFDESLGMDAVDAAACLALRKSGFTVGIAPGLSVDHAIGASTWVQVAGRRTMVTGHSPKRRASMLRNRLRLLPAEFAESPRHGARTIRRVVVNQGLGLLIERNRWENAKGTARGLWPLRGR